MEDDQVKAPAPPAAEVKLIAKSGSIIPDHVAIYLILLLAVGAAWVFGSMHGEDVTRKFYKERISALEKASQDALAAQQKESAALIRALGRRLNQAHTDHEKVKTIVKEVHHYVTEHADAGCTIPAGFVWMHDASLAGELPGLPRDRPADVDAPSAVTLSGVAEVVASNNGECAERGRVIEAWQEWYRKQKDIYERARAQINHAAKDIK